jgi:hypothetical protein
MKLLLAEQEAGMPPRARFDWSMIPDIPVSEIGWSDVTTTEKGPDIPSEQRALLMQYLQNIGSPGASFEEQIKSLQQFYGPDGPNMVTAGASSNAEAISQLISYLVFYKTLTKVVTNFNAASAGFSFESFLAVLLNGEQVKANTGTIADFTTGDNIPISLKLYTKLHVGGSWRDLVGDIIDPKFNHPKGPAMRYISGIKVLDGEGLDQKGEIKLYQFDITLDNIVDIMLNSMHPEIVSMPESMVDGGEGIAHLIPTADRIPTNEELEESIVNKVRAQLSDVEVSSVMEEIDPNFSLDKFINGAAGVFQVMQYAEEGHKELFAKNWDGLAGTKMSTLGNMGTAMKGSPSLVKFIYDKVFLPKYGKSSAWEALKPGSPASRNALSFITQVATLIRGYHNAMVDSYDASEVRKAREAARGSAGWMTVTDPRAKKGKDAELAERAASRDKISAYYKGLSPEGKIEALKNTRGMVLGSVGGKTQWDLNATQAINPEYPVNAEYLGELKIGGAYVEQMLTQVSEMLNEEIFAVFSSLKSLSDNLNGFFAGGLSDNQKAVTAIASAQDIEKKTAELKSEK